MLRRFVIYGGCTLIVIVVFDLALRLPRNIIDNYIFIGFGLAVFAGLMACYPGRMLVNGAIEQIGKISFSMYLTHFAVLDAFAKFGLAAIFRPGNVSSMIYYLCAVAATAPLAYVFFNAVEKPGIELGKRLIDHLERRGMAVVQQASRP